MSYKTLDFSDFGVKKTATTLKNGLRVVIFERKGAPIALRLCFLAGSRFDPPGKEGLSHFTEHLIISGTKSYPSKDKLAMSIEELGGTISAFTSSDVLGVEIELGDSSDFGHV